jgi:quercetin dioxygenase-like cupin family protein
VSRRPVRNLNIGLRTSSGTYIQEAKNRMRIFPTVRSAAMLLAGVLIGGATARVVHTQRQNDTVTLLRTDVTGCAGREIVATVQDVSPGDSGRHYHSGQSLTYVLQGSETWEVDGKPIQTVRSGDFMYDEPERLHRTVNTAPLKLLIVRVLEKGNPRFSIRRFAYP